MSKAYAFALMHGFSNNKGIENIKKNYLDVTTIFGEKHVLDAYEKYRVAQKRDNSYVLKDFRSIGLFTPLSPYSAVQDLIGRGDGRKYMLGRIFWEKRECNLDWKCAEREYKRFEFTYGKELVAATAKKIWEAPKVQNHPQNWEVLEKPIKIGTEVIDPYRAFYGLLTQEKLEGFIFYQIASYYNLHDIVGVQKYYNELIAEFGKEKILNAASKTRYIYIYYPNYNEEHSKIMNENLNPYKAFLKMLAPEKLDFKNSKDYARLGALIYDGFDGYIFVGDVNKGCNESVKVAVDVYNLEKYNKHRIYVPGIILSGNSWLFESVCKGKVIKKVQYLFFINGKLIRESWTTEEDSWKLLHTNYDTLENGDINKVYKTEQMRPIGQINRN